MKKMILLMPFAAISLLAGCGAPRYLELWSKKTILVNDKKYQEFVRVIENKKTIKETITNFGDDGETVDFTEETTYSYNDHGDVASEIKTSTKTGESVTNSITYEYRYNADNLITWKKATSHSERKNKNEYLVYLPKPREIEYEYDNLKRITKEVSYTNDEEYNTRTEYSRIIRTYKDKFPTFITQTTTNVVQPSLSNVFTNELDNEGYIIKSSHVYGVPENGISYRNQFIYNTYDEHHCVICQEMYFKDEKIQENLVTKREAKFYKNNPAKPSSYTLTSYSSGTASNVTITNCEYDQYDRLISEIRKPIDSEISTSGRKEIYEYDQLITE